MPATRWRAEYPNLAVRSVSVTAESGSYAVPRRTLRVQGELDLATAAQLAVLLDQAAAGCSEVDLDLSGLAFCDVVGLTAIENAQRRLSAQGCVLMLRGTEVLHLLLGISRLDLSLEATADDASLAGCAGRRLPEAEASPAKPKVRPVRGFPGATGTARGRPRPLAAERDGA